MALPALAVAAMMVILVARVGMFLWREVQARRPMPLEARQAFGPRPIIDGSPDDYVYVEDDGSARELTLDEIEYLATPFDPGDSGRSYIKWNGYGQRTPDGRIGGFLRRDQLPAGTSVAPAAQ